MNGRGVFQGKPSSPPKFRSVSQVNLIAASKRWNTIFQSEDFIAFAGPILDRSGFVQPEVVMWADDCIITAPTIYHFKIMFEFHVQFLSAKNFHFV